MLAGGYFKLPAGAWTDDTAMALCLADSLLHDGNLDAKDLLDRFLGWIYENENTSTGQCVGVGQNTFAVLGNYRRTGTLTAPPVKGRSDGNGALMRLPLLAGIGQIPPKPVPSHVLNPTPPTHRSFRLQPARPRPQSCVT